VCVGTGDQLLIADDDVVGGRGGLTSRHEDRARPADVVNAHHQHHHVGVGVAQTSRSKRARALSPMRSRNARAPEMPWLTTVTWTPALFSRSARKSGQRWLASGVEVAPSVMESPNVTTARASGGASTIISLRKIRDVIV
jgi:hypothetical protein